MARPLRVEFPGACYHVICRGNFRFPVFREDRDRELILRRLVDFSERFLVRVRSYCVMVNHLHVYARTEEANLSKFMQSFLTSFTVSYNRRHHTSGHVFQGRYKAFLVQDDSSYRDEVTRYIYFHDPELLRRDRDLFRKYMPVFDALNEAGWEPVTGVPTAGSDGLRIERFGEWAGRELYFTVRNAGKAGTVWGSLGLETVGGCSQ